MVKVLKPCSAGRLKNPCDLYVQMDGNIVLISMEFGERSVSICM